MTKNELQKITDRFLGAAPGIIVAARQHSLNRSCMICNAAQGEQHTQDCALWELIAGRIDFRRLSESRPKANGIESDTYAATMEALEQGGTGFSPTAPELEFSPAATASTEWWPA